MAGRLTVTRSRSHTGSGRRSQRSSRNGTSSTGHDWDAQHSHHSYSHSVRPPHHSGDSRRRRRDSDNNDSRRSSRHDKRHRSNRDRSRYSSGSGSSESSASGDSVVSMDDRDAELEGLCKYREGDTIKDGRYKVLGLAGQGTFGTVLECWDRKYSERVAMKVVRSVKRYLDAAYVEIDILDKIRQSDREKQSRCVRIYSHFETTHRSRRHVCIVFERLGRSLYDFLKRNSYQGFQAEMVREFAHQIVQSVLFCHSIQLTHTDLKPENILLHSNEYSKTSRRGKTYRVPVSSEVRVIDFGGATFESDHHARMVNTRQYRAPEVILGLGWSHPSDMWSLGCIVAELLTGELLFQTHEDMEHLALMEKVIGVAMPQSMVDKALVPYRQAREQGADAPEGRHQRHRKGRSSSRPRVDHYYDIDTCRINWPQNASSSDSRRHVEKAKTIQMIAKGDADLADLLQRCLTYDPTQRISSQQALNHPYFAPLREPSQSSSPPQ